MHTSSPSNPSTPDLDDISKRYTLWFQEIDVSTVPVVGGKGANLGEMVRAGMPVPPGFCITARAYYDYLHITGLDDAVRGVIGRGGQVHPDEIDPLAAEVRSLILKEEIPSAITESIILYYRDLCEILQLEELQMLQSRSVPPRRQKTCQKRPLQVSRTHTSMSGVRAMLSSMSRHAGHPCGPHEPWLTASVRGTIT